MEAQHTFDWYRKRLGNFTGSKVGSLMQKGRGEDFGQTAKKYIFKVLSERNINSKVLADDALFSMFLEHCSKRSKSISWGNEQEPYARVAFDLQKNTLTQEYGFIAHPTIANFGSSPDGAVCTMDGELFAGLEIKCPDFENYEMYRNVIVDATSLKSVNAEYYYQCVSHCMVLGVDKCYFVAYNPFHKQPLHIVEIYANIEDIELIRERVELANDFINNLIN